MKTLILIIGTLMSAAIITTFIACMQHSKLLNEIHSHDVDVKHWMKRLLYEKLIQGRVELYGRNKKESGTLSDTFYVVDIDYSRLFVRQDLKDSEKESDVWYMVTPKDGWYDVTKVRGSIAELVFDKYNALPDKVDKRTAWRRRENYKEIYYTTE